MRRVLAAFALGLLVGLAIAQITAHAPVAAESDVPQTFDRTNEPDGSKRPAARERDPELATAHARIAQLEQELYGKPAAWPENTPDLADPENYARELERVLQECNVQVDVQGYDCTEPPCYAILRRTEPAFSDSDDWWSTLKDCDDWNATYSRSVGLTTDVVHCPDGSQEGFTMLTVSPRDEPNWLMGKEPDRSVIENADKRRRARKKAAMESWRCKDG